MPLYEYQCKQCGHRFEKIQSFSAPEEKACPVCQGEVERLISAPAFQFKGAGWYVNDYAKSGGKAKGDGGTAEGAAKSESSGTTGTAESSGKSDGSSKSDTAAKSETSSSNTAASTPSTASSSKPATSGER